jgi:uncharacterized protein
MPSTLSYPGVYIEEIPSGVRTITGVSTSVAAFLGRTTKGPIDKAVRLLSLADFERNFGEPEPRSELAAAVRLFFQNGGSECYVVRLVKKGTAAAASITLKNETGAKDVLKFSAKEAGITSNQLALQIKYNASNPEGAFDLVVSRIANGVVQAAESHPNLSMDKTNARYAPTFVTQHSMLVDCELSVSAADYVLATAGYSLSRRPIPSTTKTGLRDALNGLWSGTAKGFRLSVDGSSFIDVDLSGVAVVAGADVLATRTDAEDKIKNTINGLLPAGLLVDVDLVPGPGAAGDTVLLKITSDTADKKSVTIQPATTADLAGALMLGIEQGGIESSRFAEFRPAPTGTVFKLSSLDTLAALAQSDLKTVVIDGKTVNLTNLVTTAAADKWFKDAVAGSITGNSDGVREKLGLIAAAINNADIGWTAEVWGYRLALLANSGINNFSRSVTTTTTDLGSSFNSNVRFYSLGATGTSTFQSNGINGASGDPPEVADYKGDPVAHTGFYALDLVDLFNLMVIPADEDLTESNHRNLWGPASTYCQAHRAFLIIDAPPSWSDSYTKVVDASGGIAKLRIGAAKEYCAVFYPRLLIDDAGLTRIVGPGGAIAGLMARTDSTRGVWKAPAGMDAAVLEIQGLDLTLTDLENGVLNKQGVNCLRVFPAGVVNWGARTLAGADDLGSEWKYIPVRRLALFLEESLFRGTKWVVFEPNDEPLWAQIRLNLGAFMHNLFRQGAFQGMTPKDAYFVKCDKETTTQNDINLGIVNIVVGFAPLKPAEFVVIKIQQMAGQIET